MTEQRDTTGRLAVRVIRSDDPPSEARSIAADLHADLVTDLPSAEREVRIRVDAGRRALGDPAADAELLARADEVRGAAAVAPVISDDQVGELERLASDLSRATRIRRRTEKRFNENLQAKLAASSSVALHPAAIRAAADAVASAEVALAEAEAGLAADPAAGTGAVPAADTAAVAEVAPPGQPDQPAPSTATDRFGHGTKQEHLAGGDDPVLQRPHDVFDEVALDKQRAVHRVRAVAAAIAAIGLVAVVLDQLVVAAGLFVLAVVIFVVRGRESADRPAIEHADSPSRPNEHGPAPDPNPTDEPELDPELEAQTQGTAAEAMAGHRNALEAVRAEAEERLRVAVSRWHRLAGPNADPHDPAPVVRANDPQLAYDPRLADASPTVRTVAAFHRTAQARWRVMWASFGREDTPEPEQLGATMNELLGDHRRARAELRRLEAAQARADARATVARPLVLVEPTDWISRGRLTQLLSSIPPEGQAIVVEFAGATGAESGRG